MSNAVAPAAPASPSPAASSGLDRNLKLGIVLIALANLADALSSIEKIARVTVLVLGMGAVPLLITSTLIASVVGYVLVYQGLFRRFVGKRSGVRRWAFGIALLVGVTVVFWTNRAALSGPNGTVLLREQLELWTQSLLDAQDESGGIRTMPAQPSKPQAWVTAQALTAVLTNPQVTLARAPEIRKAFSYLEHTRLDDGGWGYWEESTTSVTEITAWVVVSYARAIRSGAIWTKAESRAAFHRIEGDLRRLRRLQLDSGGWGPVPVVDEAGTRTYSTIMALWAYAEAARLPRIGSRVRARYRRPMRDAIHWLLGRHDMQHGWFPNPERHGQHEEFPGLTAQTLYVLYQARDVYPGDFTGKAFADVRGAFLARREDASRPIDRSERLGSADQHLRPAVRRGAGSIAGSSMCSCQCDFLIEGSTFVWYPWTVATLALLANDPTLAQPERDAATSAYHDLTQRGRELQAHLEGGVETYEPAEAIVAIFPDLA